MYIYTILITHCHADNHVFIQEEYHCWLIVEVLLKSIHKCSHVELRHCKAWQEMQHKILVSRILLAVHRLLDYAYVDTRETFDIYDKQSSILSMWFSVVYCYMCNKQVASSLLIAECHGHIHVTSSSIMLCHTIIILKKVHPLTLLHKIPKSGV